MPQAKQTKQRPTRLTRRHEAQTVRMEGQTREIGYEDTYPSTVQVGVAIIAIYIAIASGITLYILEKGNMTADGYTGLFASMCTIILFIFSAEFLQLAVFHRTKWGIFNFIHNCTYTLGQALLFIGMAFFIRALGYRLLSFMFLWTIFISMLIYYIVKLTYLKSTDYLKQRLVLRITTFLVYAVGIYFIIR